MKKVFSILFALFVSNILLSQQVNTDESFSQQQLIEQLVQGCVQISNVSSSINGSVNGFQSMAYFEQNGSSFPFANGLVLTSGRASDVGSPSNTSPLNSGTTAWGTDPDIEAALGVTNTLNATSIEFDFISVTNQISFNYLLASEEYFSDFPCRYSDSFAFLIRPTGSTDPYTNIAVVPGTTIPVSTSVIHDEIVGFCPAENEEYFEGYNLGDTNYNGRTTVLTATANLVPNQQYHVKLIIADGADQNADSAIFIEGNSFNATVNLGNDVVTCANSFMLNADIGNNLATYTWFLNDAEIPNSNTTSYNATVSGNYTVEISIPVGDTNCLIEDSVQVTLNSAQSAGPISDYLLCDDSSSDETETFDLSTKTPEILASIPTSTYTITYHPTQTDAENNTNAFPNIIQNTSNPQGIFVRILDTTNGCLTYANFNLIVNPLPTVTEPTPIDVCDDNSDGITEIDLNIRNDEITGSNAAYNVSYHYTQADADNNVNPIITNYTNVSANDVVYVRVVNTQTGCYTTTSLEVNVTTPPQINSPNPRNILDACDIDHDGFATFDLTNIIDELTMGITGATVSVHPTQEDATNNTNPITDITSFDNTTMDVQIVFIRVTDDASGCFSLTTIELHTNALLTATNIVDVNRCDDPSNDGVEAFDFEVISENIQNNISGIQILFYLTEEDRNNGTNPIDTTVPFNNTSNPQEIFIALADEEDCEDVASFNLVIQPNVTVDDVGTLPYCDTDDDGFTTIDLTSFNTTIQGVNPTYEVAYFATMADANSLQNSITEIVNTSNPQEVFVQLRNPGTGCSDVSSFMINVLPAPTTNIPTPILICDDDTDGISSIDLTSKISEIIPDLTNINITFHPTSTDASDNTNEILDPTAYISSSTTAYARVESTITNCFSVVPTQVIVNTIHEVVATDIYQLCETDTDQTENFIMETKDAEILNGQTGRTVLYFATAEDAVNRTNIIDKTMPYANQTNPQTIHVRIENDTDIDCFATSSFVIQVSPAPLYNEPIDIFRCDDSSNDGIDTFNLDEKIQEITQGIPQNLTVVLYLSEEDAQMQTSPITNTANFTNVANPQAIYALISNDSDRSTIVDFEINVIQVPETNSASDVTVCDTDYDGQVVFDLTEAEFEILNIRQDDVVITYHETQEDGENGTNAIATPTNYTNTNNPQPIFVRLLNTISQCYVIVPFTLYVNLPPLLNDVSTATFCEAEDPGTVDLRQIDEIIIDDATGVNLTYHITAGDAEDNINALPDIYSFISNPQTIYIRAQNTTTGCHIVADIDITINPNPIANQPNNLEECIGDNNNTTQLFNFAQQNATILGGQNPAIFSVSYHTSIEDAQNGVSDLPLTYGAFDEQIIYVRVENINTGCYATTSFMTIIHPLPTIDIPDEITLCLNDLPLTVNAGNMIGNTYLWSTGATTPSIDITAVGTYDVTVTSQYGCQSSTSFTINESELATIVDIDVVHFSDNNTITVNVTGAGEYLFSLDGGTPQASNLFEYVGAGYHTVTVSDINGCGEVVEEVVVIDYIKFFTPNNDTYNDTWHIKGIETLPNSIVYIFDRYGKLLTTLKSTDRGWDGLYRGRRMPSNDYWFLADIVDGDDKFQVKGHFTLKR